MLFLIAALLTGVAAVKNTQQKAADPNRADDFVYLIKDYKGCVAVFKKGNDRPETVLDCPLDSLPEEEIVRLKNGIPVSDEEALQKLIEAFD